MRLFFAIVLLCATASAQDWTESADTLAGQSGALYGTLTLPVADGPVPVALIIAGSGPTDRNGNQGGAGPAALQKLAHALAERGIATLRADKRGVGQSMGAIRSLDDITAVGFATDAADWTDRLQADARFSTVSIIGHSEGGLHALLAGRSRGADAVVTLAGMGETMGATLRRQLSDPERLPQEELRAEAMAIMDSLEAGTLVSNVSPPLASIFFPTVQPFLIDILRFDPALEAAAYGGPLLIVQGTTDVQVEVSDAERLAAAQPAARLLLIEDMNHVLVQDAGTLAEQMVGSYMDPDRALDETLAQEVADFLLSIEPRELIPAQ